MRRHFSPLHILAAAALFAAAHERPATAQPADADPPAERIALEIGEDTTFFTGPVNDDGTIDYVAALNQHYGEGIANEDNAFVLLLKLLPWEDNVADYWSLLYKKLGIEFDPEMPRFVNWFDYAEEHGIETDMADEMYDEAHCRPWTAADYPELAEWLGQNAAVYEELLKLLEFKQYYSPLVRRVDDESLNEVWLPHLGLLRIVGRGLLLHAQFALGRGDVDTAITDAILLHHIGSLATREITHIGMLVAYSFRTLEHSAIDSIVDRSHLNQELALRFLQTRRESSPPLSLMVSINWGERCTGLDMIQRSAMGQEPGWEYYWDDEEVGHHFARKLNPLAMHQEFDVTRSLLQVNRLFNELYQQTEYVSLSDRMMASKAFDQAILDSIDWPQCTEIAELSSRPQLPDGWTSQRYTDAVTDWYSKMLLTPAGASTRTEYRANTRRLVDATAIALLGYRDQQGELPEGLGALVPTYFEAVPIDPFTGETLVYRIDDDGSAVVYSIGDDFEDDGGVDDYREGDIAIRVGPAP